LPPPLRTTDFWDTFLVIGAWTSIATPPCLNLRASIAATLWLTALDMAGDEASYVGFDGNE
jgi:hypothetical protein